MEGIAKLGLDWTALLFYLINFGVIVFVLAKWVYKPMMHFLDERRKTIEQNLELSKQLQADFAKKIEEKETEHAKEIKRLEQEVHLAKANAEKDAKKIIQEAETEKQRIIDQAKSQAGVVQQELENRIEETLLEKIARLVVVASRNNVDPEDAASEIKKAWKKLQNEK